jgi:hypothetical protein
VNTLQKNHSRAFIGVGRNDSGSWKNIYAFLRKESEVARGRSEASDPEMRKKIERFAKGKVPPELVDNVCEEFSVSPEAMELLARALSLPPEEIPE